MARCKNCGRQVEDNCSVCPTCGQINPIKTKKVKTVDITTQINHEQSDLGSYRPKSRKVAVTLFFTLGIIGVPYLYLKDMTKALVSIISSLFIIASALLLGVFVLKMIVLPIVISLVLIYLVNIAVGIHYLTHHDVKDGKGEFLV